MLVTLHTKESEIGMNRIPRIIRLYRPRSEIPVDRIPEVASQKATQDRASKWVEEYRTGSGSDRVPFRLRELGVAERPGRYRFRFCIRLVMLAVCS